MSTKLSPVDRSDLAGSPAPSGTSLTGVAADPLVAARAAGRDALAFIWDGQEGLFEIARVLIKGRKHLPMEQALDSLANERFFAPLARKRKGSTKDDVQLTGNVLWADIDSRDALTLIKERLPARLEPSLIVDSGNKGFWVYYKLDALIPVTQIESLNKRLAALLDGDHCWNMARMARLPGSIHPESGNQAHVVSFSGELFDVERIDTLLPQPPEKAIVRAIALGDALEVETVAVESGTGAQPRVPELTADRWLYINTRPQKGQGWDRSHQELKIFTVLAHQGWKDEQIISFADSMRLPKHMEEKMRRRDYSWDHLRIKTARKFLRDNRNIDLRGYMCNQPLTRIKYLDRWELLELCDNKTQAELVVLFKQNHGFTRETVTNALNSLVKVGYVRKMREGKTYLCSHTARTKRILSAPSKPALWTPPTWSTDEGTRRAW